MSKRNQLTFKQAEGIDQIPSQLKLGIIPLSVKVKFWGVIDDFIKSKLDYYDQVDDEFLQAAHWFFVNNENAYIDELPIDGRSIRGKFKAYVTPNSKFSDTLQMIEFFARIDSKNQSGDLGRHGRSLALIMERECLAYRIVDRSIARFSTDEEHAVFEKALNELGESGYNSSRTHLVLSSNLLSKGDWSGSVRESMNSLESVLRKMTGASGFSDGIKIIQKRHPMHPALSKAATALYGYSSDEEGIRHPLVDKEASLVDEKTALYMHASCSSFISFLLRCDAEESL